MKIKDLKIAISSLDDETEVTKELLHSLSKPDWAKGKEIWRERSNGLYPFTEFKEAFKKLTGDDFPEPQNFPNIRWKNAEFHYVKFPNGFVVVFSYKYWSIQEDPTFIKVEKIHTKPISPSEFVAIVTPFYNSLSENQKNEIYDLFVKVTKQ